MERMRGRLYRKCGLGYALLMCLVLVLGSCTQEAAVSGGVDSVEGVDEDLDGVRDDVQRWIEEAYDGDEPTMDLLLEYARLVQGVVVDGPSAATADGFARSTVRIMYCLASWRPQHFATDQRRLLSRIFDTPARFEVERVLEESIPPAVYEASDDMMAQCSESVRARAHLRSHERSDREAVYFVNGILTDFPSAVSSQLALHFILDRPVALIYNPTNGLLDFFEVAAQKYEERRPWREWMFGPSPNRDAVWDVTERFVTEVTADTRQATIDRMLAKYRAGHADEIVIVAHSQGNLYANRFHDLLVADPETPSYEHRVCDLDVVAVATPAGRTVGSGAYVTNKDDLVIKFVESALPGKHRNSTVTDLTGHFFVETYLFGRETRTAIEDAVEAAFAGFESESEEHVECDAHFVLHRDEGSGPYASTVLIRDNDPDSLEIVWREHADLGAWPFDGDSASIFGSITLPPMETRRWGLDTTLGSVVVAGTGTSVLVEASGTLASQKHAGAEEGRTYEQWLTLQPRVSGEFELEAPATMDFGVTGAFGAEVEDVSDPGLGNSRAWVSTRIESRVVVRRIVDGVATTVIDRELVGSPFDGVDAPVIRVLEAGTYRVLIQSYYLMHVTFHCQWFGAIPDGRCPSASASSSFNLRTWFTIYH